MILQGILSSGGMILTGDMEQRWDDTDRGYGAEVG
jgi:hypothetical protein